MDFEMRARYTGTTANEARGNQQREADGEGAKWRVPAVGRESSPLKKLAHEGEIWTSGSDGPGEKFVAERSSTSRASVVAAVFSRPPLRLPDTATGGT